MAGKSKKGNKGYGSDEMDDLDEMGSLDDDA